MSVEYVDTDVLSTVEPFLGEVKRSPAVDHDETLEVGVVLEFLELSLHVVVASDGDGAVHETLLLEQFLQDEESADAVQTVAHQNHDAA